MSTRVLAPIAASAIAACAPAAEQHHHHHGGPLVHRFQNAEQWAKEFDDPARDAWQRPADVVAAMKIAPGMTVADLGAGTGYFLPYLSRAVGDHGKVLALDVEPDMVRYMKERAAKQGLGNVEARVVALDDPGLAAGSVDRVLIVDTWHHIDGRPAYAAKLRAALAPGGAVFVVDFKKEAHHGPPPEHRITPEQVMSELRQGGLAPEVIEVGLPEQYVVAGRKP
jgi:ubiquinone/menaquinone biosynthesis C-methylase UbiE